MDPVAPDPDPRPRAPARRDDPTDFSLDAPDDPPVNDTPPDPMPATIDFVPPPPPRFPTDATLTDHGTGPRTGETAAPESLRDAVPGYEILSELGRGGMGVVYLARDRQLNRAVALKMILSGEHASPGERDRFRREAEAVAALQHPNIVQIYDIGEAQGRPYLAFEYVGGGSLSDYLDGQPWPAKPAAALIEALARAMQFAHARGIVHRDLKPANVLIQKADPAPRTAEPPDPLYRLPDFALRVPKITDFGLAKRVDPDSSWSDDSNRTAAAGQTRTGAVVGTPSYIAPEQAAGKNRLVGPAVDVYALGAILYELLTGRPPFRGETPLDTVLQVMGDDPVPPVELNRKVPRDLQTICLKCLHKDPRKRYADAEALADDLRRFQNGLSIAARPVGRWERAAKWMNRHPAATVLGAITAIAVVTLMAVSLYFNVELRAAAAREEEEARAARDAEARAKAETLRAEAALKEVEQGRQEAEVKKQEAEARRREAERGVFALQLFKAAALGERDPQRAMKLLDDRNRCPEELRDFTWRYLRGQCQVTEEIIGIHQAANGTPPAARVAHSPDGKLVATASGVDPVVRVYDVAKKRLAYTLIGHGLAAHAVAFAPDGKTLATAGG
ncbi:MAG TPA: serine/threonine-protein kinase, partial [Gemmataceae bacterium]|nr:serine/threonine-protein kinase [Gemmataceae bacterium]